MPINDTPGIILFGESRPMPEYLSKTASAANRKVFVGGSDARIIMGDDEGALVRLWREKRGEVEPEDLSGNLAVQLGLATENLNRRWYQAQTGKIVTDVQMWRRHPTLRWMAATLDGRVDGSEVFEAKFMLPWQFSEEAAAQKHAAAIAAQHVRGGGPQCGPVGDYRRRQMGRDQGPCRSALSALSRYGRAEVLALCREWRAADSCSLSSRQSRGSKLCGLSI